VRGGRGVVLGYFGGGSAGGAVCRNRVRLYSLLRQHGPGPERNMAEDGSGRAGVRIAPDIGDCTAATGRLLRVACLKDAAPVDVAPYNL